jgi:hypothetical protein
MEKNIFLEKVSFDLKEVVFQSIVTHYWNDLFTKKITID